LKRTDFLQDAVFLAMQGIDILAENRRALLLRAIYGGGEKLKVLLALCPLRSTLTFSPPPSPCF
jgi:hypothetical protein